MWGYERLLAVLADPKHEDHEHFAEWFRGGIIPEAFKLAEATKAMRCGLPSWRDGSRRHGFAVVAVRAGSTENITRVER